VSVFGFYHTSRFLILATIVSTIQYSYGCVCVCVISYIYIYTYIYIYIYIIRVAITPIVGYIYTFSMY